MTDEGQIDSVTHYEKDSNGNIVHKPDALSADDIDITNVPTGSTADFVEAYTSDTRGAEAVTQQTDGVSTTATSILAAQTRTGAVRNWLVIVNGERQGSNERFAEIVHWTRIAGVNVIDTVTQNAPDGRTYSQDAGSLDLAMSANTYDVTATAVGTLGK